jgi:hypothetical protein
MIKRKKTETKPTADGRVHLWWMFRDPNVERHRAVTRIFVAECGVGKLTAEQITTDRDAVTCPRCREAKTVRPEPEAPIKARTAPDATRRQPLGKWPYAAGEKIYILNPRNPQRPGSQKHKRWALVWKYGGESWEEYRDAGGNPDTLRNVIKEKLAEVKP